MCRNSHPELGSKIEERHGTSDVPLPVQLNGLSVNVQLKTSARSRL